MTDSLTLLTKSPLVCLSNCIVIPSISWGSSPCCWAHLDTADNSIEYEWHGAHILHLPAHQNARHAATWHPVIDLRALLQTQHNRVMENLVKAAV